MPTRVRVVGDLFHGQVPDGAVYIGRRQPGLKESPWHNPFVVGKMTPLTFPPPFGGVRVRDAQHATDLFRDLAHTQPGYLAAVRAALAGRDLACWCELGQPCHGLILLEVANPDQAPRPPADPLDEAMHTVYMNGKWRWVTECMTTEAREAAVAAVLRYNRAAGDPMTRASLAWWD